VIAGVCYSGAAVVELAVEHIAKAEGQMPSLFLTGGEADRLLPLLKTRAIMQQDLVLRGVACLAERAELGD